MLRKHDYINRFYVPITHVVQNHPLLNIGSRIRSVYYIHEAYRRLINVVQEAYFETGFKASNPFFFVEFLIHYWCCLVPIQTNDAVDYKQMLPKNSASRGQACIMSRS